MAASVDLTVNGASVVAQEGTTVAALVGRLGLDVGGSAVAVNLEVVPRSSWATTELADQDRVEVLTAAQGG